jgi:hypothetical protein
MTKLESSVPPAAPAPLERTIASRILTTVADFRRKGTLETSLCWPAEELERLAMFAIAAKNDLVRAQRWRAALESIIDLGHVTTKGADPGTACAACIANDALHPIEGAVDRGAPSALAQKPKETT